MCDVMRKGKLLFFKLGNRFNELIRRTIIFYFCASYFDHELTEKYDGIGEKINTKMGTYLYEVEMLLNLFASLVNYFSVNI